MPLIPMSNICNIRLALKPKHVCRTEKRERAFSVEECFQCELEAIRRMKKDKSFKMMIIKTINKSTRAPHPMGENLEIFYSVVGQKEMRSRGKKGTWKIKGKSKIVK